MKKIIVFATGTKHGGGSGFQELVENSRICILNARIVAVVSNHSKGGVRRRADKLGIPFVYFSGLPCSGQYKKIVRKYNADLVVLSGWLKIVKGLDPKKTINIHPGALPRFGGEGMYGNRVHETAINAFIKGEIKSTAVSMHFVTEEYDKGPVFFKYPVLIREDDTPQSLAKRVSKIEHGWQSWITNLVAQGKIAWDGENPESLVVPRWYTFHKTFESNSESTPLGEDRCAHSECPI